ncbi:MAG TPA: YIP1 family protein [Candidatus Binatia bacterium]|nr:YIP1 family protein [Candidatus Binatia bacterium]
MNEQGNTGGEMRGGSEVVDAPPQSAIATLIGIFTSPKKTLQALAVKPRLLAPILVVVLFQLAFGLVLAQSGVMKNDALARLEAKNAPQAQIDAVTKIMESPVRFVFVTFGPVVLVFSLLITAALLYFMANLMLGARLRYTHYLSIAAYGAVVGIVDQVTRLGLAVGRGTLAVHLGVGAFLGDDLSVPLRILDTATDPLLLWATGIEALGVAVLAKKNLGFGLIAVLPGFVLLVSLSALQR